MAAKLLKITGWQWLEGLAMAGNGWKWLEIAGKGLKWLDLAERGWNGLKG